MAERTRLTDAAIARRAAPRARVHCLGQSPARSRRPRPAQGRKDLRLPEGRLRFAWSASRWDLSPRKVSRRCDGNATRSTPSPKPPATVAQHRRAPLFREFIEGEWKRAHFDSYKASSQRGAGLRDGREDPAGLRFQTARPHYPASGQALVRSLQQGPLRAAPTGLSRFCGRF